MKKIIPEVLRWIAAGFFVVSALVFLPSLASGLLLAAAILTAPLPGLDEMIREKFRLKKTARIAIVSIVFFAGIMLSPTAESSRENAPAIPAQSVTSQTQLPINQTTADDKPEAKPEANIEATSEPDTAVDKLEPAASTDGPKAAANDAPQTNKPAAEPTPEPPQEAAVEPVTPSRPVEEAPVYTPSSTNEQGYTVYITNTGSKYHRAGCRHLKASQIAIDINDAIAQGYTACKNCGG